MAKRRKPSPRRPRKKTEEDGPPLVVVVSVAALTLIGYFTAMTTLSHMPHQVHWASALVGGLVGWGIGRVYYRYKGDII